MLEGMLYVIFVQLVGTDIFSWQLHIQVVSL